MGVPDDAELLRRLLGRGDDAARAEDRGAEAIRERREAAELGYGRVVNDDLEAAVTVIAGLIDDYRSASG